MTIYKKTNLKFLVLILILILASFSTAYSKDLNKETKPKLKFMGAFFGGLPYEKSGYAVFDTGHTFTWAGNLYLSREGLKDHQKWIDSQKDSLMGAAIESAKKMAIKNEVENFAVINMKFTILRDPVIQLYLDYNIMAW